VIAGSRGPDSTRGESKRDDDVELVEADGASSVVVSISCGVLSKVMGNVCCESV
jgi:hypothetical protein